MCGGVVRGARLLVAQRPQGGVFSAGGRARKGRERGARRCPPPPPLLPRTNRTSLVPRRQRCPLAAGPTASLLRSSAAERSRSRGAPPPPYCCPYPCPYCTLPLLARVQKGVGGRALSPQATPRSWGQAQQSPPRALAGALPAGGQAAAPRARRVRGGARACRGSRPDGRVRYRYVTVTLPLRYRYVALTLPLSRRRVVATGAMRRGRAGVRVFERGAGAGKEGDSRRAGGGCAPQRAACGPAGQNSHPGRVGPGLATRTLST